MSRPATTAPAVRRAWRAPHAAARPLLARDAAVHFGLATAVAALGAALAACLCLGARPPRRRASPARPHGRSEPVDRAPAAAGPCTLDARGCGQRSVDRGGETDLLRGRSRHDRSPAWTGAGPREMMQGRLYEFRMTRVVDADGTRLGTIAQYVDCGEPRSDARAPSTWPEATARSIAAPAGVAAVPAP